MTDLCARWRGPERRAGQAPALSSMITTSPCGREQRVGQCQAPHERSGAAGCETARGVDTRTPHALCSGRHQSGPKLCAMLRLVSPGPLPGWPLPLQGCGHQARCWAPGSGSCAHRSPAPGATRRFPEARPAPRGRRHRPGAGPLGGAKRQRDAGPRRADPGRTRARRGGRRAGARRRKRRHDVRAGRAAGASAPAGRGVPSAGFSAPRVQGWLAGRSPGVQCPGPRGGVWVWVAAAGPGRARRGVAPASPQRRRFLRRPVSVSPPAPPAGSAHPGGAPGRHPAAPPPAPEPRSAGAGLAPGKGLGPAHGERDGQTRAGGSRPNPSLSLTAEPGECCEKTPMSLLHSNFQETGITAAHRTPRAQASPTFQAALRARRGAE